MGRLLKTPVRGYQARGSSLLLRRKTAALFMQQRTGKTLTQLLALARLWERGYRRVVIVCPKSAIGVWRRQARLHLKIPYWISGEKTKPKDALEMFCVNFEQTWREHTMKIIELFDPEIFIVDEVHRIAGHRSKQSYAAYILSRRCKYRWGGTGTPTEEDETDFFGEFRFIKPELLGTDWKTFERRWCRKGGFGHFARKVKKHKKKEIHRIIKPYVFTITRDEALHLPPVEDIVIPFQLSRRAAKAYRQLENGLMTEIEDEVIVTPMRVTQMIKLQQITGGFLMTETSSVRLEQDKMAIMLDWLEDFPIRAKTVVFARFSEEIEAIRHFMEKAGRTVGVLQGKTRDRTIWEDFQDKRDPTLLAIQCQTGGEAIEVSVADVGIFFSKMWSWRNYDQCRARLLGRHKRIVMAHLEAEGTIDQDIANTLERKGSSSRAILTALKRRRT